MSEQYIGTCRFCGQQRVVMGPFGHEPMQKEIDQVATDECNCDEAVAYRSLTQKCRMLKNEIDAMHIKNDWIKNVLEEAIQPVASADLQSVKIVDGGGNVFTLNSSKKYGPTLSVKGGTMTVATPAGTDRIETEDWQDEEER